MRTHSREHLDSDMNIEKKAMMTNSYHGISHSSHGKVMLKV